MIILKKENIYLMGYNEDNIPCCYHPLTEEAKELDLPLLPPFEENIENKVEFIFHKNDINRELYNTKELENAFKAGVWDGYKAAHSDKNYSLEDVRRAIEMARKTFPTDKLSCDRYSTEEIIQSLSTQQLPKEFIPEKIWINSKGEKGNKFSDVALFEESINNYDAVLKLKTIINSEGREEIQGKYVY